MARILVTSALPYANGRLHFGHLAGAYLPADIYTRFKKLQGEDVIHICGTDEHGAPITFAAKKEGVSPRQLVDKYYRIIYDSFERFGIEFDNFSRTSLPLHHRVSREFFLNLYQKGYIFDKETDQYYCETDKTFLPDRYIEGTCPYCGYEAARGDQCEECGRWLEPAMLLNPHCTLCGGTPVKRKTKHWYFDLPKFEHKLVEWLQSKEDWKPNVREFALGWIREGLVPRPITRDLDWGVTVPLDEAKGKVLYVWFDAPIGYVSSTMEWALKQGKHELWKDYWLDPQTKLIHFIGKDNIVFHAIIWPAILMGHGGFVLPDNIPANEYLLLGKGKFSTSRGTALWLDEYLDKYPADPLRYTLAINLPETGDTEFTWKLFIERNNELADVLGNFVHRTLMFVHRYMGGKVSTPVDMTGEDLTLLRKVEATRDEVANAIDRFQFKKGIKLIMELVREGNRYFDYQKPWVLRKEDMGRAEAVMGVCTTLIANLSVLVAPYLPFTGERIKNMLNLPEYRWDDIGRIKVDTSVGEVQPLFQKLKPEDIP